jgi:hypothetical protein
MKWILASALTCAALSACAKGADKVLPSPVPTAEYERAACPQLAAARLRNMETLTALSMAQDRASTNDTVAVIFVGLPLASMTGADREAELAVVKGRDLVLQSLMTAKNCPS